MSVEEASRDAIVVVRDRGPEALQNPPRRMFGERRVVWHVHATAPGELPASRHYVFNLDRFDDRSRARALRACDGGARVTVIVRHVDATAARALTGRRWNVLPAYGDTEHIGSGTLRRALRMTCDGRLVVATGFLQNSGAGPASSDGRPPSGFVRLLCDMSEEARTGVRVAAAVLSPQRTGSQWLRDLIGWTTASDVQVFHEHEVPAPADTWPDSSSLADALALEPNRERQILMRRAALRGVLLSARRRYIFVTDRDPVDRLMSYFVKRQSRWLRDRLDDSGRTFVEPAEIQRAFEAWLPGQIAHCSRWFRSTLLEPFGLDVGRAQVTADGLLVAHNGCNTLIVVPIERLNGLRAAVEAEYGADSCEPLADNSTAARGDGAVMSAFRRQVCVPPTLAKALRAIPEVAYVRSSIAERSIVGVAD